MAFFEEAVDTLEINKYKLHRVQLNRVNKKSFYFMAPVNNCNNLSIEFHWVEFQNFLNSLFYFHM